jgi:tRNA threonylcarbamoyladenosine biosynthesis protein TsaE
MTHPCACGSIALKLAGESETLELGKKIAYVLHSGLTVFLRGDLGAGKTTFARGVLRGMGYPAKVKSPTYNLIEVYKISKLYLYHFDFYRFNDPSEWEEAGFREYFNEESICLVEWPERVEELLPTADLTLFFRITGAQRVVEIRPGTDAGRLCMEKLKL